MIKVILLLKNTDRFLSIIDLNNKLYSYSFFFMSFLYPFLLVWIFLNFSPSFLFLIVLYKVSGVSSNLLSRILISYWFRSSSGSFWIFIFFSVNLIFRRGVMAKLGNFFRQKVKFYGIILNGLVDFCLTT